MALTACPECKNEVSDQAITCPHCGYQLHPAPPGPPVPPSAPAVPAEQRRGFSRRALVIGLGGVLIIIGSPLTWATASAGIFSVSTAGTEGDGIITLIAGVLVVVAALLGKGRWRWVSGIGAMAALAVGVYDAIDVSRLVDESGLVTVTVGIGLWLVIAGAAVAVAGHFIPASE